MPSTNPDKQTRLRKQISIALVEPKFQLNVGYVARVMANFGIEELFIVSPEKPETASDVLKFASHGAHVISNLSWVKDLKALKKKFPILVGTTAIRALRKSNITRKTIDVEKCARQLSSFRGKISLVFGRDTTGLTNEELKECDYVVTLNTGTQYNTLNISHAVAIILYVFLQEFGKSEKTRRPANQSEVTAARIQRKRLVDLFEELALRSDFQRHKASRLRESVERLLNRSDPSLREIYLLMGLASKAKSQIERHVKKQQAR